MAMKGFFSRNSESQETYNDEYYNGNPAEKETTDMGYGTEQPEQKTEAPRQPARKAADFGATCSMKIMKPASYADGYAITDALIANNAVILNLENLSSETQAQLICFLDGVAYAIRGNLKQVSSSTYMVTPKSICINEEEPAAEQPAAEAPVQEEQPAPQFNSGYGYQGYGSGYRG